MQSRAKRGQVSLTRVVLLERENFSGSSQMKSSTCSHVMSLEGLPTGTCDMLEQYDLRWCKKGPSGSRLRRRSLGVPEGGLFGSLKPGTCP